MANGCVSFSPSPALARMACCSCFVLLVACGGGGGASASDTTTSGTAPSQTSPSATTGGEIRQRLNACPLVTASTAANAYQCLVGSYNGKNSFDGSACSLDIAADGTLSFNSATGLGTFGPPYFSSQYNKVAYTVIPGTSSTGYAIIWAAVASDASATTGERPAQVFFKFNVSYDDRLVIDFTPKHDAATSGQGVSCELAVY